MKPNDPPKHQPASDEERKTREAGLDHTIEDTFPASDPPSTTPNPDENDKLPGASRSRGDSTRKGVRQG